MQIFEITQRQQINEVGGMVGALAGGIAKAAANQFVKSQTGGSLTQDPKADPNARMASFKANEQIIAPLAKQMQLAWAKTVQEFMSRSKDATGAPVTKLSDLSPASFNTLEPQLVTMVNNAIGRGANYQKIGAGSDDPTVKGAAQAAAEAIDKGIKAVMAGSVNPKINAQGMQGIWLSLVRDGIAPAKQIAQFDSGSSGAQAATPKNEVQFKQDAAGKWTANGMPIQSAIKDPAIRQAWDNMQKASGV